MYYFKSIDFIPWLIILSSKELLKEISTNKIKKDHFKTIIFTEHRKFNPILPDYTHKNNLEELNKEIKSSRYIKNSLIKSLKELGKYFLELKGNKIFVKSEHFEDWQNLLTLISPLPIISYFIYEEILKNGKNVDIKKLILNNFSNSTLPLINNPFLNNIFNKNRLTDFHLHINGTTEASLVFIDAVKNPYRYYKEIKKTFHYNSMVKEQFYQLDTVFTSEKIFEILKKSKKIRDIFSRYNSIKLIMEENKKEEEKKEKENKKENEEKKITNNHALFKFLYEDPLLNKNSSISFKEKKKDNEKNYNNDILQEILLYLDIFDIIKNEDYSILSEAFHFYILSQSLVNQLVVQQINQSGFDQFQKITLNDFRENVEKDFTNRFHQLKSVSKLNLDSFEIRISPKDSFKKNEKIVNKIITDYKKYLKLLPPPLMLKPEKEIPKDATKLRIITHFIKKSDKSRKENSLMNIKHHLLRKDLEVRAASLIYFLEYHPEFKKYFAGIDAASNELSTPPEVFAPVFRSLKREFKELIFSKKVLYDNSAENISKINITYHTGEDFVHILSGIRSIYETITFLDLNVGDRVGHATAIGISYDTWKRGIGKTIKIRKQEWLDSLILFNEFIKNENRFSTISNNIINKVEELYYEIYPKEDKFNYNNYLKAYKARKLDPFIVLGDIKKENKLKIDSHIEWDFKKIIGFNLTDDVKNIFINYHSSKYIKKQREIIIVKIENSWNEAITFFQQEIIKLLNEKNIAIETLPTSNLRISFYEKYKDHHIFKWNPLKKDKDNKKEFPSVIIGSDDPGIFSTNIFIEYIHIYQSIKESGANDNQAISYIEDLIRNGDIFSF